MIPNRFRDPALRTKYFKHREPNTSIPKSRTHYFAPDGSSTPIVDIPDVELGVMLIQMRDSAMVTRAMQIATMLDSPLPTHGQSRERRLNDFFSMMRDDWTAFLPAMYYDLDREAQRRGLWWNELNQDQHKKLQVEFETSMMQIIRAGIKAVAHIEQIKTGRAPRNVEI